MKLNAENACFVGRWSVGSKGGERFKCDVPLAEAQGVMFNCPKCGSHQVLCWFLNPRNGDRVPDHITPGPGRWSFTGDSLETLSLSPSVDLSKVDEQHPASPDRCYWHGFVTNGEAS